MIFKRTLLIIMAMLTLAIPIYSMGHVSAQDVFNDVCSRVGADQSATCSTDKTEDPISGSNGIISRVADIVARVAGGIAVIIILIGSLKYLTANGDTGAIKSAHNTILGALIGLVIIVLARTLIYFVVTRI